MAADTQTSLANYSDCTSGHLAHGRAHKSVCENCYIAVNVCSSTPRIHPFQGQGPLPSEFSGPLRVSWLESPMTVLSMRLPTLEANWIPRTPASLLTSQSRQGSPDQA